MRCEICDEFECTCFCNGCGLPGLECVCDFTKEDFEERGKEENNETG